jgi:hypothetical protein
MILRTCCAVAVSVASRLTCADFATEGKDPWADVDLFRADLRIGTTPFGQSVGH